MSKTIGEIYVTSDYDKFKKLVGNRDVKGTNKIIKSIERVGYVLSPILVNEKFEVVDGQNRLEALKLLGLEVPYIVQKGIGLKECQSLNVGQSNWNTKQFIKSYADSGDESYKRLLALVNDFSKLLSIEGVLCFANPKLITNTGGGPYAVIRSGKFSLSKEQYEIVRRRITSSIALGFLEFKERYNMAGRTYWASVSYAFAHEEIKPEELIQRMNEDPNAIISCAKVVDQLRYFDDAYNRRRQAQNKVFMASDIQQGRYL